MSSYSRVDKYGDTMTRDRCWEVMTIMDSAKVASATPCILWCWLVVHWPGSVRGSMLSNDVNNYHWRHSSSSFLLLSTHINVEINWGQCWLCFQLILLPGCNGKFSAVLGCKINSITLDGSGGRSQVRRLGRSADGQWDWVGRDSRGVKIRD